jgi:heme/copper-type cytochrome/quinol oxidase subunit 2
MFNFLNNIQFNISFVEAGNDYTSFLHTFYNIVCSYLLVIVFLITYWVIYILLNFTFKKRNIILDYNLNILLKGYSLIKYFVNLSLKDRSFKFILLADLKDFPSLEATWCGVPITFIGFVAYPSISLEYGLSPDITPGVTVKAIAHQWFWEFETTAVVADINYTIANPDYFINTGTYATFLSVTRGELSNADLYEYIDATPYKQLKKTVNLNLIQDCPYFYRLLCTDGILVLPANTPIKLIVTSVDVLHSLALPAFGVKIDAVPGRLSEQVIICEKPGVYWGQCSELCGPYHSFMPIIVDVKSLPCFLIYLQESQD